MHGPFGYYKDLVLEVFFGSGRKSEFKFARLSVSKIVETTNECKMA